MDSESGSLCLCPHTLIRGLGDSLRNLWANGYIAITIAVFAAKYIWTEIKLGRQLRKDIDKFQDDIKETTRENLQTYKAIWKEKRCAGGDKWDGGWDAGRVDMSGFMRPCGQFSRSLGTTNNTSCRDDSKTVSTICAENKCQGIRPSSRTSRPCSSPRRNSSPFRPRSPCQEMSRVGTGDSCERPRRMRHLEYESKQRSTSPRRKSPRRRQSPSPVRLIQGEKKCPSKYRCSGNRKRPAMFMTPSPRDQSDSWQNTHTLRFSQPREVSSSVEQ